MWSPWLILALCLIPVLITFLILWLGGVWASGWSPGQRALLAEEEAITHLSRALHVWVQSDPSLAHRLRQIEAIEEILGHPADIVAWEERTATVVYGSGEVERVEDPLDQAIAELFELARVNLYARFSKRAAVEQYDIVRGYLHRLGLEVKPASELTLGRLPLHEYSHAAASPTRRLPGAEDGFSKLG